MRTLFKTSLLLMSSLAIAGCAATTSSNSGPPTPIHASLEKPYESLDAIESDSTLVVEGRAGDSPKVTSGFPPFTTTPFTVSRTLKGEAAADEIFIFQTGDQGAYVKGLAPVLSPGGEYILYLNPYEGDSEHPGLTYVVTSVGAYEKTDDGKFELSEYAENDPGVKESISESNAIPSQ